MHSFPRMHSLTVSNQMPSTIFQPMEFREAGCGNEAWITHRERQQYVDWRTKQNKGLVRFGAALRDFSVAVLPLGGSVVLGQKVHGGC